MSNLEPRFSIYGDVSIDSLPRIEINSNDGTDSLKKFCTDLLHNGQIYYNCEGYYECRLGTVLYEHNRRKTLIIVEVAHSSNSHDEDEAEKDTLNVTMQVPGEAGSLEEGLSCLKFTYTFENVGHTASGIAPPNPEWKYKERKNGDVNVPVASRHCAIFPPIKDEEKLDSYLVQVENCIKKDLKM